MKISRQYVAMLLLLSVFFCATANAASVRPANAEEAHQLVIKNGLRNIDVKMSSGLRIEGEVAAIHATSFDVDVPIGKHTERKTYDYSDVSEIWPRSSGRHVVIISAVVIAGAATAAGLAIATSSKKHQGDECVAYTTQGVCIRADGY